MAVTIDTPTARATVRYLSTSPYKVRQVIDLVRGLPVDDAARLLQLCEKDAADDVLQLLESAVANAEHNQSLPADELYVARVWCDEGPTRKWGQARARGRYFRVRKRTSHITIVLARFEADELAERRRRDESSGRGAAVAQRRRSERVRRSRQSEQSAEHDHDHDHDHDHEHEDDAVAGGAAEVATADAPSAGETADVSPEDAGAGAAVDEPTSDEAAEEQ